MHLNMIVRFVNDKLAGETLMYDQMLVFLDATIDDINTALHADYPAFSEFTERQYPKYPNYNFFPEKYIRSVVIPGAAAKFYTTDEEGARVAPQYDFEYKQALFLMQRDYSSEVPNMFRAREPGMLRGKEDCFIAEQIPGNQDIRSWFGYD